MADATPSNLELVCRALCQANSAAVHWRACCGGVGDAGCVAGAWEAEAERVVTTLSANARLLVTPARVLPEAPETIFTAPLAPEKVRSLGRLLGPPSLNQKVSAQLERAVGKLLKIVGHPRPPINSIAAARLRFGPRRKRIGQDLHRCGCVPIVQALNLRGEEEGDRVEQRLDLGVNAFGHQYLSEGGFYDATGERVAGRVESAGDSPSSTAEDTDVDPGQPRGSLP